MSILGRHRRAVTVDDSRLVLIWRRAVRGSDSTRLRSMYACPGGVSEARCSQRRGHAPHDELHVITDLGGEGTGKVTELRADALAAQLPAQAWKKISAGAGAKGPRLYHWARAAIRPLEDTVSYWLLVRRSLTDPDDLAYYLCHGPERTPLRELVRVAGARWAIEETFQTAKGQVGLDQYQVRRYDSWYRHITLAMLAHAFLTVTTAQTNAEAGAKRALLTFLWVISGRGALGGGRRG